MAVVANSSAWSRLGTEMLEFILPQRCVACGGFGAGLHPVCVGSLPAADGRRCLRCWAPLRGDGGPTCEQCATPADAASVIEARRAAFRFEGVARRAILEAKFRGVTSLLRPLAEAAAAGVPGEWPVECVVPVPLHRSRRRERGFDQGALIASVVARLLHVPLRGDLIERVRRTRPQASLGREARARNVEDAFGARADARAAPSGALLVDDVMTTGATLESAAHALRESGVVRVFAFALAIED